MLKLKHLFTIAKHKSFYSLIFISLLHYLNGNVLGVIWGHLLEACFVLSALVTIIHFFGIIRQTLPKTKQRDD